jgi:hypothetical protein
MLMKNIFRILLVSLLLAFPVMTLVSQPLPTPVVSFDLVSPVYAALTDIDAAVKGFVNGYSSFLFDIQWPGASAGAWACKVGFERQAFYDAEYPVFGSIFTTYLGLEYRYFPFKNGPSGLFIGPMLQLQASITGEHWESTMEGSGWYLAGLGALMGYQAAFRRVVLTIVTGASACLTYSTWDGRLGLYLEGIPKTVELFIGVPM